MPELLKPRPLHVHGNFVFSVCKLLKAKEGPRSSTAAIIQLDDAQSFTQNMYGKRNLGPWACRTITLKRIKWRS